MIRWHSASNNINLQINRTSNTLSQGVTLKLVLPLFGSKSKTETRYEQRDNCEYGAFADTYTVETPFTRDIQGFNLSGTVGTASRLPLIYLPEVQGQLVMPSALGQACATGLTNTGTLALLGYGAGALFNPPMAMTYAIVGGGCGLASGVVQGVMVAVNNQFLEFCARGNDFLLTARAQGMSPVLHAEFDDLCQHVKSQEAKDLAGQIVRVCESEFGIEACRPMRQRANTL